MSKCLETTVFSNWFQHPQYVIVGRKNTLWMPGQTQCEPYKGSFPMQGGLLRSVIAAAALLAAQPLASADDWCAFVISSRVRLRAEPATSAPPVQWDPGTVPLQLRVDPNINSLQVVGDVRWLCVQNGWVREDDVISFTEAVEHFRSAAPSAFALATLSRAYVLHGKMQDAVAAAIRAVQMAPNYGPAHLAHGVALRAAADFAAAENALARAVQSEQAWCEPYRERADLYVQLHRYRDAAHDYENAIKHSPDPSYRLYMALGIAWRNCGEFGASRRDLVAASKLAGSSIEALNELHITGERERIAESNEWLKREPNASGAYLNRANAYGGLGEIDKALRDYEAALRTAKDRWAVYAARAVLWRGEGEYGRAFADLEAALREHEDWGLQHELIWWLATCPSAKHRDGRRAVTVGKLACEATNWSDVDLIVALGAAYAEAGDFKMAVAQEKRAFELTKATLGDDFTQGFLAESEPRVAEYRRGKAWRDGARPKDELQPSSVLETDK